MFDFLLSIEEEFFKNVNIYKYRVTEEFIILC